MAAEPYVTQLRIEAPPEIVFDCFCDPNALLTWMGDRADLDPKPGGKFEVDVNGAPARGEFMVLDRPRRLVFSWGFAGSDELPPGASTVEVTLVPDGPATQLTLVHSGLPESQTEPHAVGWTHFLERLAIAASGGDPGPDPWASNPSQ